MDVKEIGSSDKQGAGGCRHRQVKEAALSPGSAEVWLSGP